MDPKNWNIGYDEDEDEDLPKESKFGRDCTIFLVDCSEPMFLVKTEDGLTHFEMSMKVARNLYCQKCITSDRDFLGILFYNTEKMKNSHNFEHIYVFDEIGSPGAEKVKEIESLLKGDVRKNFKQNFGHADCKLDEAFWMCSTMFSNCGVLEGSRRIFLFTNCDNPHKNDPDQQRRVIQKIADLKDQQVRVELLAIGREEFSWPDFYEHALLDDGEERPNPANRLAELLDRTFRKHYKKRAMATIPFVLAPGVELSIGMFNMIASAKIPAAVKLDRKTNEEIKSARTFLDVETGEKLLPVDLKKFQTYGGTKISMEPDEVDRLRRLCEPGLVLLGFKKKSAIKPIYHIKPGLFMYPNEMATKGGSQLFRTLLERCHDKGVVAICRLTARRNMAPKLVALMPQLETLDDKHSQEEPPGFQCIYLPYSDDIRDLSKVSEIDRPCANADQIDKAKEIIKKLTMPYDPDTITNPVLQKHFKAIEAFALDREEIEEVPDHTKPNFDWIARKSGQLIQEFKDLVYPDDYTPGGVKKRAAAGGAAAKKPKLETNEVNLEEEAKAGRLEKLTVAQLRELSSANHIKLLVTRKADIINQLNKHYGV